MIDRSNWVTFLASFLIGSAVSWFLLPRFGISIGAGDVATAALILAVIHFSGVFEK